MKNKELIRLIFIGACGFLVGYFLIGPLVVKAFS